MFASVDLVAGDTKPTLISASEFEERALERVRATAGSDELVFRAHMLLSWVSTRLGADFESNVHRPAGITWPGFKILWCLRTAGPLQTRALARLVATTPPTVSSVLNTLERKGYVSRHRLDYDQRLVEVRLTAEGEEVVARTWKAQHEREQAWLEGVDRDLIASVVDVLEVLANRPRPTVGKKGRKRRAS